MSALLFVFLFSVRPQPPSTATSPSLLINLINKHPGFRDPYAKVRDEPCLCSQTATRRQRPTERTCNTRCLSGQVGPLIAGVPDHDSFVMSGWPEVLVFHDLPGSVRLAAKAELINVLSPSRLVTFCPKERVPGVQFGYLTMTRSRRR